MEMTAIAVKMQSVFLASGPLNTAHSIQGEDNVTVTLPTVTTFTVLTRTYIDTV